MGLERCRKISNWHQIPGGRHEAELKAAPRKSIWFEMVMCGHQCNLNYRLNFILCELILKSLFRDTFRRDALELFDKYQSCGYGGWGCLFPPVLAVTLWVGLSEKYFRFHAKIPSPIKSPIVVTTSRVTPAAVPCHPAFSLQLVDGLLAPATD